LTTLNVTIDLNVLKASLDFPYPNSKAFNSFSLVLNAHSSELEYTSIGFRLPWNDFRTALTEIAKVAKREQVSLKLDPLAIQLTSDYLDDKKFVRSPEALIDISGEKIDSTLVSAGFQRVLTDFQKDNVSKLLQLKHGANFSVPGAGKTTTLLAAHTILKSMGIVSCLFVISPINAFISWEDECREIFADEALTIVRLESKHLDNFFEIESAKPDVILVNYEKLRKDIALLLSYFIKNPVHLVLDEAHRVKSGMQNLSFRQIIKMGALAKRRDILTGTPMPQSYKDIVSQFDFLWATSIIPEPNGFQSNETHLVHINKTISPFFVRTTKNQLGLSDPKLIYQTVPLGPIQGELYELFRSEAARIMSGMDRTSKQFFRYIGQNTVKLMQAATNPMLLGTEDVYFEKTEPIPFDTTAWELLSEFAQYEQPAKIKYLMERVGTILSMNEQNKVVVWSYFVRNIKLLEKLFAQYNPVSIYGSVPTGDDIDEKTREGRIRKFQLDPRCRVLVANPQACGEGISLHKVCHFAIYLDRTFNAAHYLQSVDRIHRFGLPKGIETVVEILVAQHTIDNVIADRLNLKTEALGRVLNDSYLMKLAYDPEDIPQEESLGMDREDLTTVEQHILAS